MNNLAIILEQVLEARKIATEQPVVDQLDHVIQTILDMMKVEPKRDLPPINYPPMPAQPILLSPYGGLKVWCTTEPDIGTAAKAIARKILENR